MRIKYTGKPGVRNFIGTGFLVFFILASLAFFAGCSENDTDRARDRTLTADERYLVQLYVKIHKLETNLQNNPEELSKKLAELRGRADSTRINRTLRDLEKEPVKWIAVYNRINTLLERSPD
ncbi:MAG: hypothetical protein R6U43_03105 [Candidatus Krumholzibacteriales bacterium]